MNNELEENNITKQVKDILKITGQNEVIQSFVRSDVTHESEEAIQEHIRQLNREKKFSATSLTGLGKLTAEKKEPKEDSHAKSSVSQPYQQLGKDAQFTTKNITKKTNVKWNRRQRLVEEVYTDKDRAAAVNLGTRDIKQSLKLKRRQDRTRILEISEEAHPGTLLALALHRFKTGDIRVALKFVNKALELNPYDKNALVARSKCFLLTGNAQMALEDAEQALEEDKSFIKGLYQKAEALYHLAQFEYSLMYFHRGLHIRPQLENFKQGVHKARQAIINTVGKKSVAGFEVFLPRRRNILTNDNYSNCSAFIEQNKGEKLHDLNLLKELRTDKIYLEKLLRNPDIVHINGDTQNGNKILIEAKDGMQFLENRQRFWKQQKPPNKVKAAKLSWVNK